MSTVKATVRVCRPLQPGDFDVVSDDVQKLSYRHQLTRIVRHSIAELTEADLDAINHAGEFTMTFTYPVRNTVEATLRACATMNRIVAQVPQLDAHAIVSIGE